MKRLCTICGDESDDVGPSLAMLRRGALDGSYQVVVRCRDARACRARNDAQGDEWPITDRYSATASDTTSLRAEDR